MQTILKFINKTGINKFIKKRFPRTFKFIRDIILAKSDIKFQEFRKNISDTINTIFKNDLTVRSGPFKGMLYTNNAFGSTLFPKIIGTYEEPIQKWIYEAINVNYDNVIDIGSAEGYYSVGFAKFSNNSKIYAYDIDDKALTENKKLAKMNGVENKIIFKNLCDNKELAQIITDRTLIICDIEGAEKTLLDPKKTPKLKLADMIIEAHDCYAKNVTELLIQRFYQTHKIEIAVDYLRDFRLALPYSENIDLAKSLVSESRSSNALKWMRLTKLQQ